MNLDFIIGISEVTGAIAVVLTLIYQAIEVRNNRSATESASLDGLAAGFNTINAQLIGNREVEKVWLSGMAALDAERYLEENSYTAQFGNAQRLKLSVQLKANIEIISASVIK